MDILIAAASPAAITLSEQPLASSRIAVDQHAAARFSEEMGNGLATSSDASRGVAAVSDLGTRGEQLLSSIQRMSTELQQTYSAVSAALEGNLTISEGLKLQLKLGQMSLHHELLGKGISKSTQNIDTLVKMQ